jgi:capsule biosynthesis phosphatase|tara:strand:+ start:26 stop:376 length:351 start_codon:yes stop_codon:yes gene_type:complete
MKLKTVVVDLDGTLCEPNLQYEDTERRYGQAKPKLDVIKKLHKLNLYVIIHTSRRMKTHKGDVKKIKKDVEQITRDWLNLHNVKYDELIFGKPYSDTYYIDDKALSVSDFLESKLK